MTKAPLRLVLGASTDMPRSLSAEGLAGLVDVVMPVLERQLAGDDGGLGADAGIEDFQQILLATG